MANNMQLVRQRFWRFVEVITGIFFLMSLLVMFTQVISRYVLGIAVPWTDEVSRFSFVIMIFIGAALCQRSGEQVRITILLDVLPIGLRKTLEGISALLTVVIGIALIVGAVKNAINTSGVQAAAVPISFAWLYVFQALGIFLLILIAARDAINRFSATPNTGAK